ncbi:hypothetical protein [Humitalea rosea]|uniref:hypothetical protein n=1 Tax=Humitalea rosea TaxID=990373 RepID=UPI001B87174C|nr:hypothetical protein [Humitalea rosea]
MPSTREPEDHRQAGAKRKLLTTGSLPNLGELRFLARIPIRKAVWLQKPAGFTYPFGENHGVMAAAVCCRSAANGARATSARLNSLRRPCAQQAAPAGRVQRFALAARRQIKSEDGTCRRDHLRALAQRVEVVSKSEIRLTGSKTELLRHLPPLQA